MRTIDIEGYLPDEILDLPDEQLSALVLSGEPLVFRAGTAEILGEFKVKDKSLIIELEEKAFFFRQSVLLIQPIQNHHTAPVVGRKIGVCDLLLDLKPGLISHLKTDRGDVSRKIQVRSASRANRSLGCILETLA